jgi:hypothetical protein
MQANILSVAYDLLYFLEHHKESELIVRVNDVLAVKFNPNKWSWSREKMCRGWPWPADRPADLDMQSI